MKSLFMLVKLGSLKLKILFEVDTTNVIITRMIKMLDNGTPLYL